MKGLVFLILSVTMFAQCGQAPQHQAVARVNVKLLTVSSARPVDSIWNRSVGKALAVDLWEHHLIYDAGHFLMLPLHHAFCTRYQVGVKSISDHFDRFLKNYKDDERANDKARFHYYYLLSRYLVLAGSQRYRLPNLNGVAAFLEKQVTDYWLHRDAWHWNENFKGIRERLSWKLNVPKKPREERFLRFIFDDEKFLFAIAADLVTYRRLAGLPPRPVDLEILSYAYTTFQQRVHNLQDGGWLFQPGYLSDHPDYSYAGYETKGEKPGKKNRDFQAEDCSHSFRYPLWLRSLQSGFAGFDSVKARYFNDLHHRLAKQFATKLMVRPAKDFPFYGTRNFMDGSNGLYVWQNAENPEKETGYGPNELSFSFLIGWWSFLDNQAVREAYRDIDSDWSKAFLGHANFQRIDLALVNEDMMALLVKLAADKNTTSCINKTEINKISNQ